MTTRKTSFRFGCVLLLLSSFCYQTVQGGYFRRGSAALGPKTKLPEATGKTLHWSSTGMQGLDQGVEEHEQLNAIPVSKKRTRKVDLATDPSATLLEHHPFGSGVFTLNPPQTNP
jgi:hypothetical protein